MEDLISVATSFSTDNLDVNNDQQNASPVNEQEQNSKGSDSLKPTVSSLNNDTHFIITGKEGIEKTQLARWIAEYYHNKQIENQSCSEEIKVSDHVGNQDPSEKSDDTSELIKWKDGSLKKVVKNLVIFDSLDEAPATVTEKLSILLE